MEAHCVAPPHCQEQIPDISKVGGGFLWAYSHRDVTPPRAEGGKKNEGKPGWERGEKRGYDHESKHPPERAFSFVSCGTPACGMGCPFGGVSTVSTFWSCMHLHMCISTKSSHHSHQLDRIPRQAEITAALKEREAQISRTGN